MPYFRKALSTLLIGIVVVAASSALFLIHQETAANILMVLGLLIECFAIILVFKNYKAARKKD